MHKKKYIYTHIIMKIVEHHNVKWENRKTKQNKKKTAEKSQAIYKKMTTCRILNSKNDSQNRGMSLKYWEEIIDNLKQNNRQKSLPRKK